MADEARQMETGGKALSEMPERADAADQRVVGGRYRLLTVIGRGGMSTVYLALDTALNKQWAAKEIRHVSDPVQRELIVNSIVTEANMIKRFDHPAIPRIVDIVDDAGTLYVIMDYVEGRTLEDLLVAGGPQSEDDVVDWALQLCEVLEYLHTSTPPVIYRDMKPSNVMLKPNGLLQVIDFGIAREMREDGQGASAAIGDTVQLGTRGFAPPEQYGGTAQTDARSDVYSLGATMYNLLTDKSPAEPPYEMLPLRQVRPELSQGIERIVARATQANPDDRYQDCAEMAYDLAHYREQDDAARSRLKRTWHTFVGLATATVVAFVVGVSGTVGRIVATDGDYGHWMQIAEQSPDEAESTEAYLRATEIRPGDVNPYLGLVGRYRADLTFSPEEEAQLRSAVLPNLTALEGSPAYADLAFEIGKLYWYSYDVDPAEAASLDRTEQQEGRSARIRAAEQWMDAAASDPEFEDQALARTYANIADFNASIVPLINEGSDEGLYAPYFAELQALVESMAAEDNDVMRLEAANLALDALRTYPRKFRADDVTQDDMEALAQSAVSLAGQVEPTTSLLDAERERALSSADEVSLAVANAFVDARGARR